MFPESLKRLWRAASIRSKQLIFFAALITVFSLISLYTQYTLYRYLDEFQSTLSGYYNINRYLLDLKGARLLMGRLMREPSSNGLSAFMSARTDLDVLLTRVARESNGGMESYFLLRALRNAQEVYFTKTFEAVEAKQQGREAYYLPYYISERIVDYMEGYISQLLNVRLSEGNRYFQLLARRVSRARIFTLFGLVLIGLLCLIFAVVFSNSLAGPIRKLASASFRMSEGDLDVPPVTVESKDEVGVLAYSFNTMSRSIKDMVRDLKHTADLEKKLHRGELRNLSMQRSLREAQFLSLQAQINPHFLFNTLSAISRTAAFEKAETTSGLILSLSSLLRYTLRGHGGSVKLSEELEIVGEYLRIQNQRFGDRIRSIIDCRIDPALVEIPCFTLQPLVENSLQYGLEPREGGGVLRVKITAYRGRIRIRILDTGCGMDAEKIAEIFSRRDGLFRGERKGIGVINVATRLGLFFNRKEEFSIRSRPGRGTLVRISFPERGGGHV